MKNSHVKDWSQKNMITRRLQEEDEPGEELRELKLEAAKIAYELLRQQRTLLISEVVSPKLTERISSQLLWLDAQSNEPIKIFINTPGGSADDGFALFDIIRFI